ncbi:unnamed protein product [Sympodiomycopsis kandeliae]
MQSATTRRIFHLSLSLVLLAIALSSVSARVADLSQRVLPVKRTYDTHHYYAVETHPEAKNLDPRDVANILGAEYVEPVGELKHHWLVRAEKLSIANRDAVEDDPVLKQWQEISSKRHLAPRSHQIAHSIRSVEKQVLRRRHKRDKIYSPWDTPHLYPQHRSPIPGPEPNPYPAPLPRPPLIPDAYSTNVAKKFSIRDPIFPEQWHLANSKRPGSDLNITGVWEQGITGKGVTVAMIDDGLDFHSPDLAENFFEAGSYDFNAHTALPEPREADDQHGTRCAGEVAAIKNDVCGVGVAHEAHVAGLRILSGPISDVDEAAALNYAYHDNHVYSCSWGPPDDGRSMDAPKGLIAKAILNGIQNGRNGKGSIYVFAGGNGGASDDQCNFDGYTNSIYTITIAAVDRENLHPYYSEMCSANMATGWSSGSNDHIHTTDVAWNGINRCTSHHGGTSAAAPLVAAVTALALQIRPELTWRDMQHITIRSAQMISPEDPDWQKTQAGRHYNHKFGYGVVDAYQFIEEAKRHTLVKPQAWLESGNVTIPGDQTFIGQSGVSSTFTVTQDMLNKGNFETMEHVTVRVWITHDRRGDVGVELISPHGTKSVLARPRRFDDATTGFPGWGFMTLKHWDESPLGEWTINVYDQAHPKKTGNFHGWAMTLWGQSIDASKAKPWNFPETSIEYHETLSSAPSTTHVQGAGSNPTDTYQLSKPTDHLPSDHGKQPGESHQDFTGGNKTHSQPEGDTGYLTGLKKSSTWMWVAVGIVLIFITSVSGFYIIRRRNATRRRNRSSATDYEFLNDQDDDDDDDDDDNNEMRMNRLDGSKAKRGGRTREIYDAFRTDLSDDDDQEEEEKPLQSRNDGRYHDNDDEPSHEMTQRQEESADERFTIGENEPTPTPTSHSSRQQQQQGEVDLLGGDNTQPASGNGNGAGGDSNTDSSNGSWTDAAAALRD